MFEKRLRRVVNTNEMEMSFISGKSTDAIFLVRQVIGKYELVRKKLYMVFVDIEMAFHQVPLKVIRYALQKRGYLKEKSMH